MHKKLVAPYREWHVQFRTFVYGQGVFPRAAEFCTARSLTRRRMSHSPMVRAALGPSRRPDDRDDPCRKVVLTARSSSSRARTARQVEQEIGPVPPLEPCQRDLGCGCAASLARSAVAAKHGGTDGNPRSCQRCVPLPRGDKLSLD